MISTWKTPDSSSRALWQSYQQSSSSKAGGTGEGNYEFCLAKYVCSYLEGLFNMVKSYDMGPAACFTSPLKEVVLRIFIALKNPLPRPGLNPRTLSTVASTLTTRPTRVTKHVTVSVINFAVAKSVTNKAQTELIANKE
jgi:hypothetical protein